MSNLFSGINARLRGVPKQGQSKSPPGSSAVPSGQASLNPAAFKSGTLSESGAASRGESPSVAAAAAAAASSIAAPAKLPPLISSPSLAQTIGMDENSGAILSGEAILESYRLPQTKPQWLNAAYARHIVKGNFMTLSTRPKTVEMGEWMAHQVVDHWRMLSTYIRVVHSKEDDGMSICNARACPKMSAGANHSFTWLNSRLEPVEIPAYEYLSLVQRYISGKIDDARIFPTDPAGVSFADHPVFASNAAALPSHMAGERDWVGRRSGFPENFVEICQTIFRQMFRVYAHLYWSHFLDPMYHLNLEKSMNSCFSHFILTATTLDLLKPADLEPMQPLIDLWAANGTFPQESKAYAFANLAAGERLLQLAGMSTT